MSDFLLFSLVVLYHVVLIHTMTKDTNDYDK